MAFDAFNTIESSEDDDEKASFVYSDFNSFRSGESGLDGEVMDDEYSFDSFDTGQTLTFEAGDRAMGLLRETEKSSEVSFAPAFFSMRDTQPV